VELDFLVASADQVVDDVGGRGVAASAAEPLVASKTLDDTASTVDATISTVKLEA
jgi:hypothetical protein